MRYMANPIATYSQNLLHPRTPVLISVIDCFEPKRKEYDNDCAKLFISYSWPNLSHGEWVINVPDRLYQEKTDGQTGETTRAYESLSFLHTHASRQ